MIIWGFRSRNKVKGQARYICQQCKRDSYHTVVGSQRWFTLFFIPLFPFSNKMTSRCNLCGFQTRTNQAHVDQLFAQYPSQSSQYPQPGAMPSQYPPQSAQYPMPSQYPPQGPQYPPQSSQYPQPEVVSSYPQYPPQGSQYPQPGSVSTPYPPYPPQGPQ